MKLCAIVHTSDGIRVCEVLEYPIYDRDHLMPLMAVRAFEGRRLNPVNCILVPMKGPFIFENVTAVTLPEKAAVTS